MSVEDNGADIFTRVRDRYMRPDGPIVDNSGAHDLRALCKNIHSHIRYNAHKLGSWASPKPMPSTSDTVSWTHVFSLAVEARQHPCEYRVTADGEDFEVKIEISGDGGATSVSDTASNTTPRAVVEALVDDSTLSYSADRILTIDVYARMVTGGTKDRIWSFSIEEGWASTITPTTPAEVGSLVPVDGDAFAQGEPLDCMVNQVAQNLAYLEDSVCSRSAAIYPVSTENNDYAATDLSRCVFPHFVSAVSAWAADGPYLHHASAVASKARVVVNCAELGSDYDNRMEVSVAVAGEPWQRIMDRVQSTAAQTADQTLIFDDIPVTPDTENAFYIVVRAPFAEDDTNANPDLRPSQSNSDPASRGTWPAGFFWVSAADSSYSSNRGRSDEVDNIFCDNAVFEVRHASAGGDAPVDGEGFAFDVGYLKNGLNTGVYSANTGITPPPPTVGLDPDYPAWIGETSDPPYEYYWAVKNCLYIRSVFIRDVADDEATEVYYADTLPSAAGVRNLVARLEHITRSCVPQVASRHIGARGCEDPSGTQDHGLSQLALRCGPYAPVRTLWTAGWSGVQDVPCWWSLTDSAEMAATPSVRGREVVARVAFCALHKADQAQAYRLAFSLGASDDMSTWTSTDTRSDDEIIAAQSMIVPDARQIKLSEGRDADFFQTNARRHVALSYWGTAEVDTPNGDEAAVQPWSLQWLPARDIAMGGLSPVLLSPPIHLPLSLFSTPTHIGLRLLRVTEDGETMPSSGHKTARVVILGASLRLGDRR